MNVALLGLVGVAVLFVAAQQYFYAAHRRKYGLWRPFRERVVGPNHDERRAMVRSMFQRQSDTEVERARRLYLVSFAGALLYGVWAVLTGSLTR